jgi:hypothetical protein
MNTAIIPADGEEARAAEAADYHRQGFSYTSISEQMGIPVKDIIVLVGKHAASALSDDPEVSRRMDIERIELMISSIFTDAASGDREAINTVRQLMADKQRLEDRAPVTTNSLFR